MLLLHNVSKQRKRGTTTASHLPPPEFTNADLRLSREHIRMLVAAVVLRIQSGSMIYDTVIIGEEGG